MNGKHDVVSPTERIRFDLQGTLRHLITSGEAVVKQEASQTLRVSGVGTARAVARVGLRGCMMLMCEWRLCSTAAGV